MNYHNTFATVAKVAKQLETDDDIDDITVSEGLITESNGIVLDLTVAFSLLEEVPSAVSVEVESAQVSKGNLIVGLEVDVPMTNESDMAKTRDTTSHDRSGANDSGNETLPVYKDPERLNEVYKQYETFMEMTKALDADVTSETVRTHMIKNGIHRPDNDNTQQVNEDDTSDNRSNQRPSIDGDIDKNDSSDSSSIRRTDTRDIDANEETEVTTSTDGGRQTPTEEDLPPGIDIDPGELVDIVCDAKTIYDVQRELNYTREKTLHLLRSLDLLNFVTGRISRCADNVVTTEEVVKRVNNSIHSDEKRVSRP